MSTKNNNSTYAGLTLLGSALAGALNGYQGAKKNREAADAEAALSKQKFEQKQNLDESRHGFRKDEMDARYKIEMSKEKYKTWRLLVIKFGDTVSGEQDRLLKEIIDMQQNIKDANAEISSYVGNSSRLPAGIKSYAKILSQLTTVAINQPYIIGTKTQTEVKTSLNSLLSALRHADEIYQTVGKDENLGPIIKANIKKHLLAVNAYYSRLYQLQKQIDDRRNKASEYLKETADAVLKDHNKNNNAINANQSNIDSTKPIK